MIIRGLDGRSYDVSSGTAVAWKRFLEVRAEVKRKYPEVKRFEIRDRPDGKPGFIPIEWRSPEEMERRQRPLTREEIDCRLREIEATFERGAGPD